MADYAIVQASGKQFWVEEKKFYDFGTTNTCSAQAPMSSFEFEEIFGAVGKQLRKSTLKDLSKKDPKKI